jgi:hypothetical protein
MKTTNNDYKLTKISDDVFNGFHPNGIDKGYTKSGEILAMPKVGECFYIAGLRTSRVTVEMDAKNIFKTRNSTYQLLKINDQKEVKVVKRKKVNINKFAEEKRTEGNLFINETLAGKLAKGGRRGGRLIPIADYKG